MDNGANDLPRGVHDDNEIDAIEDFGTRVSPRAPHDATVPVSQPEPFELVERLTGLPAADLPGQGSTPAANPQKLLGLPMTIGHDPLRVVIQLRGRAKLSAADSANIACALGWIGWEHYRKGRTDEARTEYEDALGEIDRAQKLATAIERSRINDFSEVLTVLRKLL
jgi:hypothetical protein